MCTSWPPWGFSPFEIPEPERRRANEDVPHGAGTKSIGYWQKLRSAALVRSIQDRMENEGISTIGPSIEKWNICFCDANKKLEAP